jgi:TolA-binding protein
LCAALLAAASADPGSPNTTAAIIVAIGTAIAAVAGVLRLRSRSSNGIDNASLRDRLVRIESNQEASDQRTDARIDKLDDKVDQVLLLLGKRQATTPRRRSGGD